MYKLNIALVFITLLNSCSNYKSESKNPNATPLVSLRNKSDCLNFMYFNAESPSFDSVLNTYHAFIEQELLNQHYPALHCNRNCCEIILFDTGKIQFEENQIPIDSIQNSVFQFLANKENNEFLSEKTQISDSMGSPRWISKGYFQFTYSKSQKANFQDVYIETRKGIDKYKESLIKEWFADSTQQSKDEFSFFLDTYFNTRSSIWKLEQISIAIDTSIYEPDLN